MWGAGIVQHARSFSLTRVVASALWVLQHLRLCMHLIGQEYLLRTRAVFLLQLGIKLEQNL